MSTITSPTAYLSTLKPLPISPLSSSTSTSTSNSLKAVIPTPTSSSNSLSLSPPPTPTPSTLSLLKSILSSLPPTFPPTHDLPQQISKLRYFPWRWRPFSTLLLMPFLPPSPSNNENATEAVEFDGARRVMLRDMCVKHGIINEKDVEEVRRVEAMHKNGGDDDGAMEVEEVEDPNVLGSKATAAKGPGSRKRKHPNTTTCDGGVKTDVNSMAYIGKYVTRVFGYPLISGGFLPPNQPSDTVNDIRKSILLGLPTADGDEEVPKGERVREWVKEMMKRSNFEGLTGGQVLVVAGLSSYSFKGEREEENIKGIIRRLRTEVAMEWRKDGGEGKGLGRIWATWEEDGEWDKEMEGKLGEGTYTKEATMLRDELRKRRRKG